MFDFNNMSDEDWTLYTEAMESLNLQIPEEHLHLMHRDAQRKMVPKQEPPTNDALNNGIGVTNVLLSIGLAAIFLFF